MSIRCSLSSFAQRRHTDIPSGFFYCFISFEGNHFRRETKETSTESVEDHSSQRARPPTVGELFTIPVMTKSYGNLSSS